MESARRRDRQGSTRCSRLDQVFEYVVEKRWQRIFLQPLRQAGREKQTALAGLQSQTLLPPARHAAVAGQIDLRTDRPKGMALQRRSHRRRALSDYHRAARDGPEEPDLL